ncbi:MAG: conjugal transfer protein TrbE [Pseudobdellovibrionaceae bacterium]|nr:conjugal transfer protein TrbE [Pseudobdellovibrionaceae bacterium]
MLKLKRFRDQKMGLADLLNFACLPAPGVLFGKDGSLTAFYRYHGLDVDSSTGEELGVLSARINASLSKLGNGWMIKTDAIRRSVSSYPMPENAFSDPLTQAIDDERRRMFKNAGVQFETIPILMLTYMPPLALESKFYRFLVDEPVKGKADDLASKHLEKFEQSLAQIEMDLAPVISMRRLMSEEVTDEGGKAVVYDEILQYLNYMVTGNDHPVRLPACPMYIDAILGWQDFIGGLRPRVGPKHISVLTIEGFPQEAEPAILRALSNLGCEYRWNTRFIFMDREESRKELESYRKKWRQKVRGFRDQIFQTANGRVDEHAVMKVREVDEALTLVESGVVGFGYYTSVVILLNEDTAQLREDTKEVMRRVADIGFSCREETINAVEAWLGSLPSHSNENVRRPIMHTMNLADLLPMTTVWSGEEFNPHSKWPGKSPPLFQAFTSGNTAFRGHLHSRDVGHFFLIGPTGFGKSMLLNFLDAQFLRYPGARIFAFDKKYSKYALCMGLKGLHYDIGADNSTIRFCPLAHIHEAEAERNWAVNWLVNLCECQGLRVQPHHRTAIFEAVTSLSKAHSKTMTDLNMTIQNLELREVIKNFTLDGPIPILDGADDQITFGRYQSIEMEHLMNLGDRNVLPILEYIFHKIESSLDGSPVLLPIDEAWTVLKHPVFKEKIRQWLKEMRSKNVAVGLATQSISDADQSDFMDVILESCPTKIFTANPNAGSEESRKYYKKIGLSDRQIEIIANLVPKRQYYIVQPLGQRVIDLGVGKLGLKWLGAGDLSVMKKLKDLISQYPGDGWVKKWEEET